MEACSKTCLRRQAPFHLLMPGMPRQPSFSMCKLIGWGFTFCWRTIYLFIFSYYIIVNSRWARIGLGHLNFFSLLFSNSASYCNIRIWHKQQLCTVHHFVIDINDIFDVTSYSTKDEKNWSSGLGTSSLSELEGKIYSVIKIYNIFML